MKPATFLSILLLLLSCAQTKQSQTPKQMPNAIPVLRITNDTTARALKISSLAIDVRVAANIATTTWDIVFFNPNDRILEGEFEFPMADGQQVVRYALDIEGKLREGVVVEKAKARVAFENTIRRKIDPGLLEKTKGNNFRTRIYPLPAKGTRHILIAVEQTLEQINNALFYQLPLFISDSIDNFSLKASVIKSTEKPLMEDNGLTNFQFEKWQSVWQAEYKQNEFAANQTIAFTIPPSGTEENIVITENYKGQTYFYANRSVLPEFKKKQNPKSIGLFWDISASGEKRNLEKEKQLLKDYLSAIGDVKLSVIPFNIRLQEGETFNITNGNSDALLKKISEFTYDGGTHFGAIDFSQYNFDEILLFTDGLATFGKKELKVSSTPVTAVTSSPSADFTYLKYVTQQSHGKFIDLSRMDAKSSLREISNHTLNIVSIDYDPAELEEVVAQLSPVQSSGLSFSGKLKANSAIVKVHLGFGKEISSSKTFTIAKSGDSEYDQVKRIWAGMKIAELDLRFNENKEAITTLGKEFSIVTQNTSLIILDRVEDYAEHEITPPEELRKEYFSLLEKRQQAKKQEKAMAFNESLDAMKELKDWWQKKYDSPEKKATQTTGTDQGAATVDSAGTVLTYNFSTAPAQMERLLITDSETSGLANFDVTVVNTQGNSNYLMSKDAAIEPPGDNVLNDDNREESKPEIELKEWKAVEPYLNELEKTPAQQRVRKYIELKKIYADQAAFFIDVAGFFTEKKEKQFALQVLSNVAEMKLESPELLRMLANQLLEIKESELAIETFADVMKMREEDPQSYRDMALALSETGKYNEAVRLLYNLIVEPWDLRFGDIKAIAINEMNAIISAHKEMVDLSGVDKRLVYAMPVDIRIVIGWSSDNSDVDLWVTDPRNEKCLYSHSETQIGGRMSKDVTQGYGPEEFCLRRAINGKFKVEVNLFGETRQTIGGPITIKADLFTDFGKPGQKRETINFRVKTNKEVVELGALKFGT